MQYEIVNPKVKPMNIIITTKYFDCSILDDKKNKEYG